MTQQTPTADQQHRDRIKSGLDENLFVEAGAGTGKTTALVGRIVTLIASGKAEMHGLAAITFTEAAAAELRDRVRRDLEAAAVGDNLDADSKERCRRAVAEMDAASVQTLHSFAQSLLRELPLEAGLPPGFEMLDPIEADLRFQEAWDAWLDEALDSDDLGPMFARALHLGLDLDELRRVAAAFNRDYDLVEKAPITPAPEPAVTIGKDLASAVPEIESLLPLSHRGEGDELYGHALRVLAIAEQLPGDDVDAPVYERATARLLSGRKLNTNRGRVSDWDKDPVTGKNGCTLLKETLREMESRRERDISALRTAAFTPALEAVRRFVKGQAKGRKTAGRAEFHDLLVWARDMLRDNADARRRFQRRFHHILLDEFQDTDPIQVEIAFFLAGDPDDAASAANTNWQDVKPVAGKLFMVGDPKQSIYRFRRADIVTMAHARDHLVNETTPLQQNFRSREGIIAWVNHVFGAWMRPDDGSHLQADYRDLIATGFVPEGRDVPTVHRLGGQVEGNMDAARRCEGQSAAMLVRAMREDEWQVRDPLTQEWRQAKYQDVCILMPSRTGLNALESALEAADVPYRIESESIVLGTEDVRQLLNCLRAIDSPGDSVALVAALRSAAFACSDVELLQFADDGGRFDFLHPGRAAGPVADALAVLRGFHEECGLTPPDEFIERFIRERRLVELSFSRRRPRERWRRLRFVVEQTRAYLRAGGSSLRGFLDWIERQAAEGARSVESPAPGSDEDCVRVMTIHAAKGLEFPIVVLTGFGGAANRRTDSVIVDRTTGRAEVRLSATGGFHVDTQGFEEARGREKAAGDAEGVRLAYVACTRARDHLVVSVFRPERRSGNSRAAVMEERCSDKPDVWHALDWEALVDEADAFVPPAPEDRELPSDDFVAQRAEWASERQATIEAASLPQARAVTAIAQASKGQAVDALPGDELSSGGDEVTSEKAEGGDGEISYRRGRGATNLGRAVHAVLQSIDLMTGEGLEDICRAQAEAEGIDDQVQEVIDLSRNALESETVRGLREAVERGAAGYYREVFVSAELDGALVEGFIDLLIDGPDGVSIVDYKTDRLTAKQVQELGPEYEVQLGLYAWAVGETTKRQVKGATLLFLRPEEERAYDDIDALIAQARAAAGA